MLYNISSIIFILYNTYFIYLIYILQSTTQREVVKADDFCKHLLCYLLIWGFSHGL